MFDVGFSELVVIGLVALIVIGPERLPKVARTVGILLGRLQRYVNDVKADISREMQLDELKKLQEQVSAQARDLETSVTQEMRAVEDSLNRTIAPPEETSAADTAVPLAEGTTAPEVSSLATVAAEPVRHAPANQPESGLDSAAEKIHG
ncbi:MAG: Sec-independent protein translocase protein TatB [Sterolibacterium sp.]|nr:Sec-independent protein translocase protein TatB [Sterolibacterium sp.]